MPVLLHLMKQFAHIHHHHYLPIG